MKKWIVVTVVFIVLWWVFFRTESVTLGPGVFAPDDPEQQAIETPQTFTYEELKVTPLATFHITAKLLSKTYYHWDKESNIAPVDLAVGWGKMSDESVLKTIKVWQSHRFFHWSVDTFPIPRAEIESHSGNIHVIPAKNYILSSIDDATVGSIIELSGKLVQLDGKDGLKWRSSLSRSDTGKGACELVWVEEFRVVK